MKTIGIITFFKSYNYGVWLQAVATQCFFNSHGYDAQVINYTNIFEDNKTKFMYKENDKWYGYVSSFIKSLLFGKVKYYRKGFYKYLNNYYTLSEEEYHDLQDMQEITYDVLVAGSDQLWNPETTSGKLDKAFFLQFGKSKKRISMATSIGSTPINQSDKEEFRKALKEFDSISVREQFAMDEIRKCCDVPVKVIMDPTFLLTRQEWLEISKKNRNYKIGNQRYILTYFISSEKRSERYRKLIEDYSRKLKVPVWAIQFSTARSTPCDRTILGASISDFISLIHNAALVLTDSFHGIALSVNLNADFIAINNTHNPERVNYLLNSLDLLDRIEMDASKYTPVVYENVNNKVSHLRADSIDWIINALEN